MISLVIACNYCFEWFSDNSLQVLFVMISLVVVCKNGMVSLIIVCWYVYCLKWFPNKIFKLFAMISLVVVCRKCFEWFSDKNL